MVNVFPYLAIRYQADDVPTTVVNGHKTLVGTYPEAGWPVWWRRLLARRAGYER